jgi:hypothetical protein
VAKKKVAKKTAASSGKATSPRKSPREKGHAHSQWTLSDIETQAFDLAQSSEKVCKELELAVTKAAAIAVRKIFRLHKIHLNVAEAANLTVVLFGE